VVALVVVICWAVLLAVGLFGQDVAIPRTVTEPAGVIAVIALAFLIPGSALFGLLRDRPIGKSSSRQIWMAWRWRFAIGGACMAAIAFALLIPSTRVRFRSGLVESSDSPGHFSVSGCPRLRFKPSFSYKRRRPVRVPSCGGALTWYG
jgi:hypothetical protein